MPLAHLNIGSNQGDRLGYINRAISLIDLMAGRVVTKSDFVESEPWGFDSVNRFYNVGVNITTDLEPEKLLDKLQQIEREIASEPHRNPDGSYRDRPIDIDIILYGDVIMSTERLTIPHPHMCERDFVIRPLLQISTTGQFPGLNQ